MSIIGNIGGQSGGGSLTKSILIVTAPTGSTVTVTKGATTKTAMEKNGEWWFKNLENGEWTIRATLDGQSATAVYKIEQFGVYRTSIAYFKATINVTYPAGSTCTATDGKTTLNAPDTSGTWACIVPNAGEWTVTASTIVGGKTKSVVVQIESNGQTESAVLAYELRLTQDDFDRSLNLTASFGEGYETFSETATKTKIDFTSYDNVTFDANDAYGRSLYAFVTSVNSGGSTRGPGPLETNAVAQVHNGGSIDVSTVSGEYYLVFFLEANWGSGPKITVSNILIT